MSQVSGHDPGLVAPGIHRAFEILKGAAQRCAPEDLVRRDERKARPNMPGIDAGGEQRGAQSKVREPIPVRFWNARDEAV